MYSLRSRYDAGYDADIRSPCDAGRVAPASYAAHGEPPSGCDKSRARVIALLLFCEVPVERHGAFFYGAFEVPSARQKASGILASRAALCGFFTTPPVGLFTACYALRCRALALCARRAVFVRNH